MVLKESALAGELYDSLHSDADDESIANLRKQLSNLWNPVLRHDLDKDAEVALQRLRDAGSFV